MNTTGDRNTIVVGVDGSEASVEALRQAEKLATAMGAQVDATACWEYPLNYAGYVASGIDRFQEGAAAVLNNSVEKAFGPEKPANVTTRLLQGPIRPTLIDASKDAAMLVVGRRGHGGFGGLLLGSVSSACIAYAKCPVLVVHSPQA